MSWIDIVWPMSGAASLTLGLIHLSIWLKRRTEWTHLAFSVVAISVMGMSIMELLSFRVDSPAGYGSILRWAHLLYAFMVVALVTYVHLRFAASRPWLGLAAIVMRLCVLLPNFLTGDNLNFMKVESLATVNFGGDTVNAPLGPGNPWMLLGQLANLLLVTYLIDIMFKTWRSGPRDQRRSAIVVCSSILLFLLTNNTWSVLVVLGVVTGPIVVNITFVFVMLVMSYELGGDVLRAAFLSESLADSQRDLRESERRLQLAATAGGLGLWTWKVEDGGTWLTDNGNSLLGLAPGDKIEWNTLLARAHPDDMHGMQQARDAALGGAPYAYEFRFFQKDGSLRWLAVSGRREEDDVDGAGVIRGVLQDVTDRRHAEERFRLVVENSPSALLMIDKDGRITLANERAEKLLGYDRSEFTVLHVDVLLPPDSLGGPAGFNTLLEPGPVAATHTLMLRRKDGNDFTVELILTPMQMEETPYTIASITDISERLMLEQQASMQRDELAHLSRVALLGEISGSIAHEINQPLTAVLSNAQAALRFMKHDPPNWAEVHESLVHIVESDKRASEVIRRLRAMMRKDSVPHERIDVNETVRESMQLLANDLINQNVACLQDAFPALPAVVGDAVQIKQVMLNLIINACDAMKENTHSRLLVVRTLAGDDGKIEITVSDTGSGIPPEDIERIFTPFLTTKPEGIGLGLAICRTIIQAHGGHLWATNNDNGGATFHVSLMAAADVVEASAES